MKFSKCIILLTALFFTVTLNTLSYAANDQNTRTVSKTGSRQYWPTQGWRDSVPEKQGMNSAELLEMNSYIKKKLPHIRSVLVVKNGYLVFDKYYQSYGKNDLLAINSATKTITSALIGIAINKGYLKGTDQKITEFFPEYVTNKMDPQFKKISIENLLTMTSGLDWVDDDMYKPEVHVNAIKYAFGLKVLTKPGEKFNYNTLGSQILSAIITKTTKMSELEFADKYLFGPLGINKREWKTDEQGYNLGGFELYLRTQDMAKFGYLLLNKGAWDGKQIIPPDWVSNMTKKHNDGGLPHGENYGYHCWVTKVKGYDAYFAGGYGGQFIYVVPALDLVVAISSNIDMHHEENRDIISKYIIPSIEKLTK